MKVYVRNKLVSLGGSSVVTDAEKNPLYKVKGKLFSPTRKKIIKDVDGNKLFIVRNKWFNWFVHSVYVYDATTKKKIARIKDKLFNFKKEYFVTGYQEDIQTQGGFFSLTTTVYRNGVEIGAIRRQITWFADAFEVEADEQDIPFMIAFVIAIDNIVDKKSGQRN